jgi:hypothetical protein
MRILLVSSGSGSRGGGEIFLVYLGQGLADRGHEVLVWIPDNRRMDELSGRCSAFGRVIRSKYRNTYDHLARSLGTCLNWGTSQRVEKIWEDCSPDVIHINKQNLEDGLDLLRAARKSVVPSICTIHLTQTAQYLGAKGGWLRDWVARDQLKKFEGTYVAVQERRHAALDEFLSNKNSEWSSTNPRRFEAFGTKCCQEGIWRC